MKNLTMYNCTLTTLTPIHIGSGEKFGKIDYVFHNNFLTIVDIDKLIAQLKNPVALSNEIERAGKNFSMELFLKSQKINIENVELYTTDCPKAPTGEVIVHIKESSNLPFIPGSSIKGAIRTALLWNVLKEDASICKRVEDAVNQDLQKLTNDIKKNPNRQKRIIEGSKRKIGKKAEEIVFGENPNYDLLRALQISDTICAGIDNLQISEVNIMSAVSDGYKWKEIIVFLESLKIGTKLEGSLKIDEFLLEDKIAKLLKFNGKQELIRKISEICNYFASEFIENEIKFYNKYKLSQLAAEYERLANLIPPSKEGFLLHFGWGSGWHGMTIGRLLQEDPDFDFKDLRRTFSLGKRGIDEFPKTRKIVFERNQPKYPLGWVNISLK